MKVETSRLSRLSRCLQWEQKSSNTQLDLSVFFYFEGSLVVLQSPITCVLILIPSYSLHTRSQTSDDFSSASSFLHQKTSPDRTGKAIHRCFPPARRKAKRPLGLNTVQLLKASSLRLGMSPAECMRTLDRREGRRWDEAV